MYTHLRVSSYTPGCARRLGIAGALAAAARVVLLDAPTANVDMYTRPLVARAILRLQQRNCIVIMAEHKCVSLDSFKVYTTHTHKALCLSIRVAKKWNTQFRERFNLGLLKTSVNMYFVCHIVA